MTVDSVDLKVFLVVLVLLVFLYFWVRRSQCRQRSTRQMKERCRDLILDHRHALAAAGVDIEGLVNLVRMEITCEQLEAVIRLLTRPRRHYDVDSLDAPEFLEVDLDIDRRPDPVAQAAPPPPAAATAGEPAEAAAPEEAPAPVAAEPSPAPASRNHADDRMQPEEEKTWLKLAHKRFRDAITKRNISERRARLRLLVRMVELGKKAVDEDLSKSGARKEYERRLWDRFYENEYLELNSD